MQIMRMCWRPSSLGALTIHKHGVPVVYTDNILELTVPLVQESDKPNARLDSALHTIEHSLMLISHQIRRLMHLRLRDLQYHALLQFVAEGDSGRKWQEPTGGEQMSLLDTIYCEMLDKENPKGFARNIQTLDNANANIGTNIDGVVRTHEMCIQLEKAIDNINPKTMSVNSLLDASRMLNTSVLDMSQNEVLETIVSEGASKESMQRKAAQDASKALADKKQVQENNKPVADKKQNKPATVLRTMKDGKPYCELLGKKCNRPERPNNIGKDYCEFMNCIIYKNFQRLR